MTTLNRRELAALTLAPFLTAVPAGQGARAAADEVFATLEAASGGRLGVAVIAAEGATLLQYRGDERFALCSTFKALLAAAILKRVDAGETSLAERLPIAAADLLSYAPITKTHVGGEMSLAELCEAAVTLSDNTAANRLLAELGGPAALTAFARGLGDEVTRLDRYEPELNQVGPGEIRDTTTPAAYARTIARLVFGPALSIASRDQLVAWLIACQTGGAKLRAGLPSGWRVGDKTGSGPFGSSNDVAVVWPDGRSPFVIASYLTQTEASDDVKNATHAAVARAVVAAL